MSFSLKAVNLDLYSGHPITTVLQPKWPYRLRRDIITILRPNLHRTGHHTGFSVRTVLAGHILTQGSEQESGKRRLWCLPVDGVDDERADLLFGDRSKKPPTKSIGTHSVAYCILFLVTVLTSREFAAAISLSSSSTIYKRLLSMHSKSHALSDYCRGVDNDYCRDTAAQRKS